MIASLVVTLAAAAASLTPCEGLSKLKLDNATIVSATVVPEGPAPTRAGGARAGAPAQAPQTIPAHCRVRIDLRPTSDSHIEMEMWLPPVEAWNGKFMGVGNGGFAGSIQGLTNEMPQALRRGYATAGTDTGHQTQGGE